MLRGGLSKDERAEHLGVVPATVKWHLHSLYFKRLLDEALADAHRLAGLER